MNRFLPVAAITLAGLIGGCASDEHVYFSGKCVTCVNNPITGQPLNYDSELRPDELGGEAVGTTMTGANMSGQIQLSSRLDVDTAYARAMQLFKFRSPEQIDRSESTWGAQLKKMDGAWMHERTPGSYYTLSDYSSETLYGRKVSFTQKLTIVKNGSGCDITLSYAPRQNAVYDGNKLRQILSAKAEKLLR